MSVVVAGHVAPGGQVERGCGVGGDDVDDCAALGTADLFAELEQEGDAQQAGAVDGEVRSGEGVVVIGCSR